MGLLGGLEDDVDEGGDVGYVEDAVAVEVVGIVLFHCAENYVDEACHVGHIIFLLVSLLRHFQGDGVVAVGERDVGCAALHSCRQCIVADFESIYRQTVLQVLK